MSFSLMNSMWEASKHPSPRAIISVQAQNKPLIHSKTLHTTSSFITFLKHSLLEARREFGTCHWIIFFLSSYSGPQAAAIATSQSKDRGSDRPLP